MNGLTEVQLEKIKLGAMTTMAPMMLHDLTVEQSDSLYFLSDMLAVRMTGFIYGKRGLTATDTKTVKVAKFPRWVPRWLRNRWTTERTIRLDCTPMIVFPDVPHVFPGTPRVVMFDKNEVERDS